MRAPNQEWCLRHAKKNLQLKIKRRILDQEKKEAEIHRQVYEAGTPFPKPSFSAKDLTPAMRDMMATGVIRPDQYADFRKLFNGVEGMRAQGNQVEYDAAVRERKKIAVDLMHAKEVKTTEVRDRHLQAARAGHEVVERVITQLPDGTTTTQERVEKRNQEAMDEKEHVEVKTESREVFIARIRQYEERAIEMHYRIYALEKGAMTRRTDEAKDANKLKDMFRWIGFGIWRSQKDFNSNPALSPKEMQAQEMVFSDTLDLIVNPLYLTYAMGQADVVIPNLEKITMHFCGVKPPGMEIDFFGVSESTIARRKTREEQHFVTQNYFQPKEVAQHWLKADFFWNDGYQVRNIWVPELLMRSHAPYLAQINHFMEDHLDYITNENIQGCRKTAELEINPTITPEMLIPQVTRMTDDEKREADVDPHVFQQNPIQAIIERRKPQPSNVQGGFYEQMAQNMKQMQKAGKTIDLFGEKEEEEAQPRISPAHVAPLASSAPAPSSYLTPLQRYHGMLEHMFDHVTEEKIADEYEADMKILLANADSMISTKATYADQTDIQVLYEELGCDPTVFYRHYLRGIIYPGYKYMPTILKAEKVAFFDKTPGMIGDMGVPIWQGVRPWVKVVFSESITPKFQEGIWLPALVILWCKTLCKCRLYNCQCRWRCIEPAWDAIDKAVCSHRDAKTRRSYDIELDP